MKNNYNCPNCNHTLQYDLSQKKLLCDNCQSSFEESSLTHTNNPSSQEQWNFDHHVFQDHEINVYQCSNCGAKLVTSADTTATICIYCNSSIVPIPNRSGILKPHFIIPFAIDEGTARRKFRNWASRGLFFHTEFKILDTITYIKGSYVPFWLVDVEVSGVLTGKVTKEQEEYQKGNYLIKETYHYKIERHGTIHFSKLPVDASLKMDDALMDAIEPFNYEQLTSFSPEYLSGFYFEHYDLEPIQMKDRIIAKMKRFSNQYLSADISSQYDTFTSKDIRFNYSQNDAKYALLPIWQINYNHKGTTYSFIVNGQTGKVSGRAPISLLKILIALFSVFIIVFVFYTLFISNTTIG